MRRGIMIAAVALTVAACERQAERPAAPPQPGPAAEPAEAPAAPERLSGFSHAMTQDLSGYYMPVTPVQAGTWRLRAISVLPADEMRRWEAGERGEVYGPIMLEFDDTASPTGVNELGQEYHTRTARVLPEAYEITDARVRFRGRSPELGVVALDARLDGEALSAARRNLGAGEDPALTGMLTVGDRVFEGQAFRWWMGD